MGTVRAFMIKSNYVMTKKADDENDLLFEVVLATDDEHCVTQKHLRKMYSKRLPSHV